MEKISKYIWILFWLFIPQFISSILADSYWRSVSPAICYVGEILSMICGLAAAYCFYKLASSWNKFIYAALFGCIGIVFAFFMNIIHIGKNNTIATIVLVDLSMIIKLVAEIFEFRGYMKITEEPNEGLSRNWKKIWLWNIIFSSLYILGAILVLFEMTITAGSLLSFYAPFVLGIIQLVRLLYLYRTAKVLQTMDSDGEID